ncbi:Uncharacterized mitochondrial protein AtMg00310 [Linum perenne]
MALLGKQGWNFIANLDALITKVYRGQYFLKEDFLSVGVYTNPSVVWRSICEARAVIQRGYRWKIGSSDKINIYSELWLPDKENFFMEVPVINGMEDMTAKYLLIAGLKEWVGELFGQRHVSEIWSIPIKQSNLEDMRIWGLSRNGEYIVRSGYRVAMERIFDQSQHHVQGNWTELWNVEAPPRMKVLLWRVTRNVLPNRMVLQQRRILIP